MKHGVGMSYCRSREVMYLISTNYGVSEKREGWSCGMGLCGNLSSAISEAYEKGYRSL